MAVQTKGLGFSFQAAMNSVIAFSRSFTLRKEPRRIRLLVNSPNQALDQIQPTGTGGHKVRDKARVALQPGLDLGLLVRTVVVHHQMQAYLSGELLVEAAQKLQELLVAMPLIALSDHPSLQDLQSGEQRGRSVAFVVMRHGSAASLFHGQARLRAIQRLDLALFIHAEHDGLLRRIEIEAHHLG